MERELRLLLVEINETLKDILKFHKDNIKSTSSEAVKEKELLND